ncbi:MAG: energy transducer TonB [Ectothiorhodospiraceae bacterium]|nr:energy transducer TonB [Ectothiorhodospiraceae bacterium]
MAIEKTKKADIKGKSRFYFEVSLALSLLLLVGAFKFFPDFEQEQLEIKADEEIVKIEDIENTRQENRPPPPPRPPIPIEAPSDDALEDIDISSEFDLTEEVSAPKEPPAMEKPPEEEEEIFFEVVEDPPEIVGGLKAIQDDVVYPELAKRAGIEGTVVVIAYVDKTGKVTRAEVAKGIGGGCDEAAVEAVMKNNFKPGMQRGKPVNVKVAIPIRFRLN